MRKLSSRVRQELDDVKLYIDLLPQEDREWLLLHYINPELMQSFPPNYPQEEKRRIWRKAKREQFSVDGCPGWLIYNSYLVEPALSSQDLELQQSICELLDTL